MKCQVSFGRQNESLVVALAKNHPSSLVVLLMDHIHTVEPRIAKLSDDSYTLAIIKRSRLHVLAKLLFYFMKPTHEN